MSFFEIGGSLVYLWSIFCILQEKIQDLNQMFVEYFYRSRNQLKWSTDIWAFYWSQKRAYFASNTYSNSPNDQDQRQVRLMTLS